MRNAHPPNRRGDSPSLMIAGAFEVGAIARRRPAAPTSELLGGLPKRTSRRFPVLLMRAGGQGSGVSESQAA